MIKPAQRSWISPLVAITYIAISVTGILMLFHIRVPGIHSLHQWGGILFIIAGLVHLLSNRRTFRSHFKRKEAAWAVCAGFVLLLLIALSFPQINHNKRFGKGIGAHQKLYNL